MNNFCNDYNERSMDRHFSMMPVLAQEFLSYAQFSFGEFSTYVNVTNGAVIARKKNEEKVLFYYRDLPITGCNSRYMSFKLNGFEYSMHVFLETDMREWAKRNLATDKIEKIDCQTFVEEYGRFKKKYIPEGFSC